MKNFKGLIVVIVAVLLLSACGPAAVDTPAPAEVVDANIPTVCSADRYGCAKIEPGQTIKIGMGSPMTAGDASLVSTLNKLEKLQLLMLNLCMVFHLNWCRGRSRCRRGWSRSCEQVCRGSNFGWRCRSSFLRRDRGSHANL